jgi:hypothetical protein
MHDPRELNRQLAVVESQLWESCRPRTTKAREPGRVFSTPQPVRNRLRRQAATLERQLQAIATRPPEPRVRQRARVVRPLSRPRRIRVQRGPPRPDADPDLDARRAA